MKIVTHSGPYHLDDVVAGAVLTAIYSVTIERTRDPTIISTADIAFDVGGGRYDHHFRGAEKRPNGITYSACGLIWRDYGEEFLKSLGVYPSYIKDCWNHWDRIIMVIDANDNGESNELKQDLNLASIVGAFNGHKPYKYVVGVVLEYMKAKTASMVQALFDSSNVMKAINNANGGKIIELPYEMNWQKLVNEHAPNAWYVVYPQEHQWRVMAVPIALGSYTLKNQLHKPFCGAKPEQLKNTGLTFVHANGFTAAGKTRESILKLIELSMKNS